MKDRFGVSWALFSIEEIPNIEEHSNETIVKSETLRLNLKSFQGLNSSSVSRTFKQKSRAASFQMRHHLVSEVSAAVFSL